jgi:hypothetical protein
MSCLGLDIGGTNLKGATTDGWCASSPFPLWRQPERLAEALAALITSAPQHQAIALAMTGELADCFRTKADGVRHICRAAEAASGSRPLLVYLVAGRLATASQACELPRLAAAANWHALANFVGRKYQIDAGLLVDLGSTTCDLIPLVARQPAARGHNDTERLLAGELVYTGVVRSPVCGVVDILPYRGMPCPTAREFFATTRDVYLLLDQLPEDAADRDTADGRPATREFARERLARCVCADRETFDEADAIAAARAIRAAQSRQIAAAAARVTSTMVRQPDTLVLCGQGEFLLGEVFAGQAGRIIRLSEELGPELSRCATAYAVAALAESQQ